MSTLVSALIDDAAQAIGDPNKQRVQIAQWLSIYNMSLRELCQKANVLKTQDIFTLDPVTRYAYPGHMVVLTGIEVSETPDDEGSFRTLDEMFEEEFREATSRLFPTAALPTHYYATSSFFYLVPMVTTQIEKGGCLTHFGLPENDITDPSSLLETPDFTRDYVTRRMVVYGLRARHRYAEAKDELALWQADVDTLHDKMEDRSIDRRATLAPRRNRFARMR